MESVDRDQLTKLRLQKVADLVVLLRSEIADLRLRLNLVEIHNDELQELFAKLSADQETIAASIDTAFQNVDSNVDEGSFNADENDEIESAEDLSSDDDDFDFSDLEFSDEDF